MAGTQKAEQLSIKKTQPRASAQEQSAASSGSSAVRHFEFVEGSSSKFWEVSVKGCEMTVRYGRIGTAGRSTVKKFADAAPARREADKLIAEKTGKGYVETGT
jgi:DNA ligase 1